MCGALTPLRVHCLNCAVRSTQSMVGERSSGSSIPRGYFYGTGPSPFILFVQFRHVEAAVAALRAAELDRDYVGIMRSPTE
ncbi:hypothetical protein GCM10010392_24520 [Streptomyces clavifer]|nr:hypothetical protein GCM10010392_24520 [Streptomyces clavifer]